MNTNKQAAKLAIFYFLLFSLSQLLHRIKKKKLPYKIKVSH